MALSPRACSGLIDELMKRTDKDLKRFARGLGICLGYDAATKRGTAQAIVAWIRNAGYDEWGARELVADDYRYIGTDQ